jgi:hypothetical protein
MLHLDFPLLEDHPLTGAVNGISLSANLFAVLLSTVNRFGFYIEPG